MPKWRSENGRASLVVHSENLTGRFDKANGSCSYQGTNSLIAYEDYDTGVRHMFVAEELNMSEDDRYVYFQLDGRLIEEMEQIPTAQSSAGRVRRRRTNGVRV